MKKGSRGLGGSAPQGSSGQAPGFGQFNGRPATAVTLSPIGAAVALCSLTRPLEVSAGLSADYIEESAGTGISNLFVESLV